MQARLRERVTMPEVQQMQEGNERLRIRQGGERKTKDEAE